MVEKKYYVYAADKANYDAFVTCKKICFTFQYMRKANVAN